MGMDGIAKRKAVVMHVQMEQRAWAENAFVNQQDSNGMARVALTETSAHQKRPTIVMQQPFAETPKAALSAPARTTMTAMESLVFRRTTKRRRCPTSQPLERQELTFQCTLSSKLASAR